MAEVLLGSFKQGIAVLTRRTGVNTGQQGQYVKRLHRIKCFSGVNDQPLLVCPASGQSEAVGLFRNGVLVVASEVSQLALVRLLFMYSPQISIVITSESVSRFDHRPFYQ